MRVRFHPAAEFELHDARNAFSDRDPESEAGFELRVQAAIGRLLEFPRLGTPISPDLRSLYLRPFPYHLVYRAGEDGIVVVAIAHTSQGPADWARRLDS